MASTPLYVKIRQHLQEMIERQDIRPGERIPAELALTEMFSTTRATVRKAVDGLVNDNLVVRAGRKGTYVSARPWERHLNRFQTCYEDLVQRGLTPSTEVLNVEIVEAGAEQCRALQRPAEEKLARIERLRSVEGEPFVLMTDWLPLDVYRPILGEDLAEGSLYYLLENKTDFVIGTGKQTLGVAALTPQQADLLGVPKSQQALEMTVVAYSELGVPFLYGRYLFRGDRYRLTVTLKR